MEYVAVFFTHSGAIKYDKYLKSKSIESTLMPVPRKLSSSCGIGCKFLFNNDINSLVCEDINKIFYNNSGVYEIIYEND
ncbi:DUF3343 domain-containing protein [Clostridium sp.]|uniref:DUF3343 domain-containing protein n=1 Tax=Clostridium sp. TaxID=1506 RepID=UPI002FC5DA09